MAIVIVGGHSRNVGKTSVVARLIEALREYQWTAVKITQFGHGICSVNGEACDCAVTDDLAHTWNISEERNRSGKSDSSRFLVSGAARSLWVRTRQGNLAEAMPDLRRQIAGAANVIIESNSALKFIRPDIYLAVLDPATADFKDSAREFLDRATALIMHQNPALEDAGWKNVSLKLVAGRPIFYINPPEYVTAALVEFVQAKLGWMPETAKPPAR